ncbi:uncharacterized protein [Halyomorpha halys]|uniref:uncharacterized protein isoform X2 n=1 Tax=Halyomorpha halys TaxID=286706 RepID=UPI0006D5195F
MSPSPLPINTSSPLIPSSNTTYYTDEEEQEDTGFSEIETVALACFLTLLPLFFGLISYFGFRHCWIRWRRTVEPSDLSKAMTKEATERTKSSHALLNDQLSQIKTSESEFSVVATDEGDEPGNQTSKSTANGSIITMTMKNNHLIVETEERLEGAVATVEVGEVALELVPVPEGSTAIVHAVNYKPEFEFTGVNTGLSTSDLSSSSEASTNRGYKYGTQEEYRGEEEYIDRQTKEIGNRREARPSLDLEPRQQLGLENPAFIPTPTLAEAS